MERQNGMHKLIVGCGYLGRRVARAWLSEGHRVSALTRSITRAGELADQGIIPIVGDICEPATLMALPAADTVLFAIGFDRSAGRSQRAVYVDGLNSVLQRVAARTQRFIYISSSSVYGQSAGEWVDETSPCQPVQVGGECCLAAEELVQASFPISVSNDAPNDAPNDLLIGGPSCNILRLSGIYGPDRLLSRVAALRAGEPIAGRGDAWLNLIQVDDAVLAVRACEAHGRPGRTYLVSDDAPIQRGEYYRLLARLTGSPAPTFRPDAAPSRGSGGINKRCSNRRLREELGLSLAYPTISVGLPHAIESSAASPLAPAAVPPG